MQIAHCFVSALVYLGATATASQFVIAMALCHNVTPVVEEDGSSAYQASSPDEIALVKYTEELGVRLVYRSQDELHLQNPHGMFGSAAL